MFAMILVLHVLGATVWTGGHLVLALSVLPQALRFRQPALILEFEERFERLGIPALMIQVVTGLWLARRLIPDPGLWLTLDTIPARHISAKLILLLITVVLAVHARLRILPKLDRDNMHQLAWHIIAVTIVAILFLVVGVGFRVGGVL